MTATVRVPHAGAGPLLRSWRERRRLSQLDLAVTADVSTRHLSYVETGRSTPSRELLLHLAEQLDVPLRDRNQLLLAAGYAPVFTELHLDAPEAKPVADALRLVLARSEPFPAIVVDRLWNLVLANAPALAMTAGVADHLLRPPVNLVRLSLHPDGLAPRIVNFAEMAAHIVTRLRRQLAITGDAELGALVDEATTYVPADAAHDAHDPLVVLPLRLDVGGRVLSFFSTIATFGTAVDVTIAELSIETMYPADDATAAALRNGWVVG